jgi:hypothetical protein
LIKDLIRWLRINIYEEYDLAKANFEIKEKAQMIIFADK